MSHILEPGFLPSDLGQALLMGRVSGKTGDRESPCLVVVRNNALKSGRPAELKTTTSPSNRAVSTGRPASDFTGLPGGSPVVAPAGDQRR